MSEATYIGIPLTISECLSVMRSFIRIPFDYRNAWLFLCLDDEISKRINEKLQEMDIN